ncbi:MAG: hypothetical protein BWK73_25415 [Thiothrix lacustris]|uniref:Uncharacterized protein n=1 Tax=Thiothrix lacustris TaxID=525917 RepID=A0A1Y1QLJ3_9GAMM|nr:MAG: hypothetical protein BWK73_25415 [Thiothrix lacustris]
MYKHLLAIPFIILTVLHSHDGYGLEQPWHGYLAATGMAALLWVAYYHVIYPTSKQWVRVLAITFALLISGYEAIALYQHKGHLEVAGYAEEKAEYDRKLTSYNENLAAWKHRTKQVQDQQDKELKATSDALQEIVDNDKLTSQRVRYDELTEKLSKMQSNKPELAPEFALKEPVKQYVFNTEWLFTVGLLVSLTPIAVILLHLFEHRVVRGVAVPEQSLVPADSYLLPVELSPVPVVKEQGTVAEEQGTVAEEQGTVAEKITSTSFPTFPCPICGAAVVLNRVDRTTCGAPKCRKALLRRNKSLPLNVVNISKRTKK